MGEIGRAAATLGGIAANFLVEENERDAVALASSADFELDERGMPIYPEGLRDQVSWNARRSFDRTLDQRYQQRIALQLETQLNLVRDRYPTDLNGFSQSAAAVVEGFAENVPEKFRAFYQDAAAQISQQIGSRVGWGQTQQRRDQARDDMVVMFDRLPEIVGNYAYVGDLQAASDALANAEEMAKEGIRAGWLSSVTAEAGMNEARGNLGYRLIERQAVNEGWTAEQYVKAAWDIEENASPEMQALLPTRASRQEARQRLMWKAHQLEQDANASKKLKEDMARLDDIRDGQSDGTKSDREIFDLDINPSGDASFWWTNEMASDGYTWNKIAQARILPQSLVKAMNSFSNRSPEEQQMLFAAWKQATYLTSRDGSRISITGIGPTNVFNEGIENRMAQIQALTDAGYTFESAITLSGTLEGKNLDSLGYENARKTAGYSKLFNVEAKFDADLGRALADHFADEGLTLSSDDRERAKRMLKVVLATEDMDWDMSLNTVTSIFDAQTPDTKMTYDLTMGGEVDKHRLAPDAIYRDKDGGTKFLESFIDRQFELYAPEERGRKWKMEPIPSGNRFTQYFVWTYDPVDDAWDKVWSEKGGVLVVDPYAGYKLIYPEIEKQAKDDANRGLEAVITQRKRNAGIIEQDLDWQTGADQ